MVKTCYVFNGSTVLANNEQLAIVFKPKGDQAIATGGKVLIELHQNRLAEEVDFQVTEECVVTKCSKSTFKLPYFKEDQFIFNEPKEKYAGVITINDDLLKGIEICLTTVSTEE